MRSGRALRTGGRHRRGGGGGRLRGRRSRARRPSAGTGSSDRVSAPAPALRMSAWTGDGIRSAGFFVRSRTGRCGPGWHGAGV